MRIPTARRLGRTGVLGTAVLVVSLAACPSAGPEPASAIGPPDRADGATGCEQPLPEEPVSLATPSAQRPVSSRWVVRVDGAIERLRADLDQALPVKLAAGQAQSPGSPGRVSYSVQRQGLELRVEREELIIDVPVVGHASVCVAVGPLCPSIGSCSPALRATAHVPLDLGPGLALRTERVDIEMTRGCVIAGRDASSRILSGAGSYRDQIRTRLDERLPSIRTEVESAWQRLQEPVRLDDGRCALASLERVTHRPVEPRAGSLSFLVALSGALRLDGACPPRPSSELRPMPRASRESDLSPTSEIVLSSLVDWPAVVAALEQSIGRASELPAGVSSLRVVEARAATSSRPTPDGDGAGSAPRGASAPPPRATGERNGARTVLALRVRLSGRHCGELWLLARPTLDTDAASIRLSEVELAPGQPERARLLGGVHLEAWLAEHARIDRPQPSGRAGAAGTPGLAASLQRLLAHATRSIDEASHVRTPLPRLAAEDAVTSPADPVVTAQGLMLPELGRAPFTVTIE